MTTAAANSLTAPSPAKSFAFSFGDPEPILSNRDLDYLGVFLDLYGDYYRPPLDFSALAKLEGANAYHGPILRFKLNMACKWFVPNAVLSLADFELMALNFLITGNGYLQKLVNRFGKVTALKNQPSIPMRRMRQADQYLRLNTDGSRTEFLPGEIVQVKEPDIKQDVYGIPPYYGGIQAVLLGEDSTLFRRKYYVNGAHLGYILVTNDADLDDATVKAIEAKVKESKGPGNFRSMYMNISRSTSREPVKVIPVGNVETKDEFEAIKNITEREMLAMHRMQPGLCGIIPQNVSGFGDVNKSMQVYYELEVTALQQSFLKLNEVLGFEAIRFSKASWEDVAAKV